MEKAALGRLFRYRKDRETILELINFLQRINDTPEIVSFAETIATIDAHYDFTPTEFRNGELHNAAGQNNGSCKIFSFARLHQLSPLQTLHCFGDYYRQDVLGHPEASDHQNIRNFIKAGWDGIRFKGDALHAK